MANAAAPTLSGGIAGGSTRSLNAIAAYSCNTGYTKSGSNPTCQSGRTWSAAPTCTIVSCPAVAAPIFGSVSAPSGVTYGQNFIYDQDFRFHVGGYRESQPDVHSRRIPFYRGIEKLFNLGKIDYFVEFTLNLGAAHAQDSPV